MQNSLDAYGSAFDSVENHITLEGNGAQTGPQGRAGNAVVRCVDNPATTP